MGRALCWIGCVACAEIAPIDAPYGDPACADWSLPVDGGTVVTCSAERIVVRYPGRQLEPVADHWRTALVAEGWTVTADPSAPGSPALSLAKAEAHLVLGVVYVDGDSVASVARAP